MEALLMPNVFNLNDQSGIWVVANSKEEAMELYATTCLGLTVEQSIAEDMISNPCTVPESELHGLIFRDEDGSTRSFWDQRLICLDSGEKPPFFLAWEEW